MTTLPRSFVRPLAVAALAGIVGVVACSETPTAGAKGPMLARIVFFAPAGSGERIAVHFTTPRNGTRVTIQRDTFDVQAGSSRLQPVVDITDCVDSAKRCTLYASLMLVSSTNIVLDSSEVGPFIVTAGGSTQTPSVTLVAPGSVRLSRSAFSMIIDDSSSLSAIVFGRNGDTLRTRSVAWESRNPTIASVSSSGVVRAISAGATTVVARSGEAADSARVTVSLVPVAQVSVTLGNPFLTVGANTQAIARATDSTGVAVSGRPVVWSSSAPTVAVVDESGMVTAISPGTTSIAASVEGTSATADLSVFPAVSVSISTANLSILPGDSRALTATVAGGLPGGPLGVVWSTRSAAIATVNSAGVVTAVSAGTTNIVATSVQDSTRRDSAAISVTLIPCGGVPPALVRFGTIAADEQWSTAHSPIVIRGALTVTGGAKLRIDPGVSICGAPSSSLTAERDGTIEAIGTRQQPISFQPADFTRGWIGVRLSAGGSGSPVSRFMHVQFSGGPRGGSTAPTCNEIGPFQSLPGHAVLLDTVLIHDATGMEAARIQSKGSLLRSVTIDSARSLGPCQTVPARGAVLADGVVADGLTVRNAEGAGIQLLFVSSPVTDAPVVLGNVRLELNGAGLVCDFAQATKSGPIIITRNRGVPFNCPLRTLAKLAPDSMSYVNWLGNQRDTVVTLSAGTQLLRDTVKHFGVMPWRHRNGISTDSAGVIELSPGAVLVFNSAQGLSVIQGGRLIARGTHSRPVIFTATDTTQGWAGIFFDNSGADSSYIVNSIVEHAGAGNIPSSVWVQTGLHPIAIDSSWIRDSRQAGIVIIDGGVRLSRTLIDTSSAIGLAGQGVSTMIEDVIVRGSRQYGAHVRAGSANGLEVTSSGAEGLQYQGGIPPTLQRINVFGNAGEGVRNVTPVAWSLANVWWGDPTGPNGPNGDGVSALISWMPPSPTRFTILAAPPIHP